MQREQVAQVAQADCVYKYNGQCLRQLPMNCEKCPGRLAMAENGFVAKWKDPLQVVNRNRENATESLRNMLAGGGAFLMGGGPSVNDLPLELLARRGAWTLCVNNSAGHPRVRPQAFVCSDPPRKFSHSIWLDPGIMKFVPIAKLRGYRTHLRQKVDGQFSPMKRTVVECPNVWAFKRWSWLTPDDQFFLTDGACWGNHGKGSEQYGQPKTVCTMLLGLRLLRFLGAGRIYLLGVDFRMASGYGYSFNQARDAGAVVSNNAQFSIVNNWLCEMQQRGVFERFGLEVFNCFQFSGLRAFPYVPFEDAVADCVGTVEAVPDLAAWYDPEKKG